MIAYLKGKLAHAQAGYIIIDVGGIGYKVQAPLSLQDSLPPRGGEIMLYTHLVVREDGFYLYGFQEQSELESFFTGDRQENSGKNNTRVKRQGATGRC